MPRTPELKSSVLWPEWKPSSYSSKPSYGDIMGKFGTVVDSESDNDYQGDTFAIIEREGEFGWLTFGWGSCSGCDSLEAADTHEEMDALVESLWNGIVWHPSREALREWLSSRDWKGQFSWHEEAMKNILIREIGAEKWAAIEASK